MTDSANKPKITRADLPAASRVAGRAAADAQRKYFWLVGADLALIIVGTIATSWAIQVVAARVALAIVGAVALGLGSLLTLAIRATALDKIWFGARAIAESIKTLAWRYMMRAEPFGPNLDGKQADESFCKAAEQILEGRRSLGAYLTSANGNADQITAVMRALRDANLTARASCYLEDRIQDQQNWYARQGLAHRSRSTNWLVVIAACQALAVVAAILLVRWPTFDLNLAPILSALATAFLAWLQARRHQDLANAYGLASNELGLILARGSHIVTDDDLSSFVADAENAISREHTMWLARRDTI